MPSYEYECADCGKRFTVVERMSQHGDKAPRCPACKSAHTRQVTSTFFAKTVRKS